jgi:hypothetical protein
MFPVYMYEYLPSYARTYVSSGESVVKDGDWALFIIIEDFAHIPTYHDRIAKSAVEFRER